MIRQKLVCHIGDPGVRQIDPLSEGIYQHSEVYAMLVSSRSHLSKMNIISGLNKDEDGTYDIHLYPSLLLQEEEEVV